MVGGLIVTKAGATDLVRKEGRDYADSAACVIDNVLVEWGNRAAMGQSLFFSLYCLLALNSRIYSAIKLATAVLLP